MEDLFDYIDSKAYLRFDGCTEAGKLDTADSSVAGDAKGGPGSRAGGVPHQPDLVRKPKVAKSDARDRLLDIVGREPGRFM